VDGAQREVRLHVPTRADAERRPLAIGFHGYTATAAQLEGTSELTMQAEREGFLVAYVQGAGDPPDWSFPGHAGSGVDDVGLVVSLIDRLTTEACADPARVILFGHSMGGGMASAAACALADRVAGAVLVSAFWADLPCVPARPVPVVAMHALDDPVLPYDGGMVGGGGPRVLAVEDALAAWAEHDGCDAEPSTRVLDGGVVELAWAGCAAAVRLLRASVGGHDWALGASAQVVAMLLDPPAAGP
jgi:polyhydroxybutyrate depolymerase